MFKDKRQVETIQVSKKVYPSQICSVDNYLNQDWNINEAGWLRNDISALAAATTKEQYELILRRMKEMPVTSNLPKGVPIKDAFDMIKPRMCQTENEYADFVGFLTEKGMQNVEQAYTSEFQKRIETPPVQAPEVKSE